MLKENDKTLIKFINDDCDCVSSIEDQLKESVKQVTNFEERLVEIVEHVG